MARFRLGVATVALILMLVFGSPSIGASETTGNNQLDHEQSKKDIAQQDKHHQMHDHHDTDRARVIPNEIALSGDQWIELARSDCKLDQEDSGKKKKNAFKWPFGKLWHKVSNKCERDPNTWRYKYGDEVKPFFNHLVKDKSVDERLANIIYLVTSENLFDKSFSAFNSGDPSKDAENELRVVGSQVNDRKCFEELEMMSSLYDDLLDTLARLRVANETTRASSSLGERHIRLARVLDSFGRYESGSLHGKNWLAGHYEECIGSQLIDGGGASEHVERQGDTMIQMRYCWANMDIKRHLHPLLKERKRFKQETAIPVLNVAVCLPRSCHSKHFHDARTRAIVQRFIDSQLRLPDSIYLDESLQLDSVFCLVDDDSEWARIPVSGKLCLLLFSLWTALCLIATVANRRHRVESCQTKKSSSQSNPKSTNNNNNNKPPDQMQSWIRRICKSLDLFESWRDLFSDKRPVDSRKASVDLDIFNPVKLASCAFCVISHAGLILGSVSAYFGEVLVTIESGHVLMAALLSSGVIDGFFTISGILVTYSSLSKLSKSSRNWNNGKPADRIALVSSSIDKSPNSPTTITTDKLYLPSKRPPTFLRNWFNLALNRYMRIVPLYALLFWFRRDLLDHLGSGPMWDHGLNYNTPTGTCSQEPWYTPFTFISAFRPVAAQCFPTSWSISNDIFFAIFTPPITLMFHYKPKLATVITCSLILASTLASIDALINSNPALVWEFLEFNTFGLMMQYKDLSPIYAWPIYRISPFLVGALAGYCLFKHESTHAPKWPQWFSGPLTLLSCFYFIAHTILAITFNDLKQSTWPLMRLFVFFNFNLDRVIWSMASSVLFLQMVTTWRHSSLMQNFSSQLWRTLAKLSYSVIFVHWMLLIFYISIMPSPPLFTLGNIFAAASLVFPVSFVVGALLYILFENPINKLVKRELLSHLTSN